MLSAEYGQHQVAEHNKAVIDIPDHRNLASDGWGHVWRIVYVCCLKGNSKNRKWRGQNEKLSEKKKMEYRNEKCAWMVLWSIQKYELHCWTVLKRWSFEQPKRSLLCRNEHEEQLVQSKFRKLTINHRIRWSEIGLNRGESWVWNEKILMWFKILTICIKI